MSKPRKTCANCGHHRSAHHYEPVPDGDPRKSQLGECSVCLCPGWRQPLPYERVTRLPYTPKTKTQTKADPYEKDDKR